MSRNTRDPAQGDGLSLDVLESVVGAAGLERKQDLTAEQAAALTAGTHDAPPLAPTNDPGLTPKQIKEIEDKFHTSAATPMKIEPTYKHAGVEREDKYIKGQGWTGDGTKHFVKGTAYDQRDHDAKTAAAEHEAAKQKTKAAEGKLADVKVVADKLIEHHKASKDLLKAEDRPRAPVSFHGARDAAADRNQTKVEGASVKHIDDVLKGASGQVHAKYEELKKVGAWREEIRQETKDEMAKQAAAQKAVHDAKALKDSTAENLSAIKKGELPSDHPAKKAYNAAVLDHQYAITALKNQTIETQRAIHSGDPAAQKTEKALQTAAEKAVHDTKALKKAAADTLSDARNAAKKGAGQELPADHPANKAYKAAALDHQYALRALKKQTIDTDRARTSDNYAAHKAEQALLSHEGTVKAYAKIRGIAEDHRHLKEHPPEKPPEKAKTLTADDVKKAKPDPVAWQKERLQKAAEAIKSVSSNDSPSQAEKKLDAAKAKVADSKEKEAAAKTKADDLAARNSKAAVDAEKKQSDRNDLKSAVAGKQAFSKTLGFAHDALLSAAKDQAIKDKTYEGGERQNVLAGGVSSEHTSKKVGDKTVDEKLDKIAQVKTTSLEETYSGTGVFYAHKTQKTITAEAGVEKTTSVTGSDGVTHTQTLKANASITGEYLKKGEITATRVAGEIGVKAVGHAEASVTTSDKYGSVTLTHTMAAVVHGEAGAKAGGSIGLDGLKVSVGASAEIVAKACDIHEATIGNVTIKNELEIYATAKAQAKAEAEVNFNPFSGEKVGAKVSAALEASAGVGIQDTISINKNLDIGAGAYIGKIGAKADVDIGVKDGKVNLNVDVGAALGVGISVKFKAEVDVAGTANKAAEQIRNGNVVEKAGGVLSFLPPVFLARALFG